MICHMISVHESQEIRVSLPHARIFFPKKCEEKKNENEIQMIVFHTYQAQ